MVDSKTIITFIINLAHGDPLHSRRTPHQNAKQTPGVGANSGFDTGLILPQRQTSAPLSPTKSYTNLDTKPSPDRKPNPVLAG